MVMTTTLKITLEATDSTVLRDEAEIAVKVAQKQLISPDNLRREVDVFYCNPQQLEVLLKELAGGGYSEEELGGIIEQKKEQAFVDFKNIQSELDSNQQDIKLSLYDDLNTQINQIDQWLANAEVYNIRYPKNLLLNSYFEQLEFTKERLSIAPETLAEVPQVEPEFNQETSELKTTWNDVKTTLSELVTTAGEKVAKSDELSTKNTTLIQEEGELGQYEQERDNLIVKNTGLSSEISSKTGEKADLEAKKVAAEAELPGLQEDVDYWEGQADYYRSKRGGFFKWSDDADGIVIRKIRVQNYKNALANLGNARQLLLAKDNEIAGYDEEIDAIKHYLNRPNENEEGGLNKEKTDTISLLEIINSKIRRLKTDIGNTKTDISNLESDLTNLDEQFKTLTSTFEEKRADIQQEFSDIDFELSEQENLIVHQEVFDDIVAQQNILITTIREGYAESQKNLNEIENDIKQRNRSIVALETTKEFYEEAAAEYLAKHEALKKEFANKYGLTITDSKTWTETRETWTRSLFGKDKVDVQITHVNTYWLYYKKFSKQAEQVQKQADELRGANLEEGTDTISSLENQKNTAKTINNAWSVANDEVNQLEGYVNQLKDLIKRIDVENKQTPEYEEAIAEFNSLLPQLESELTNAQNLADTAYTELQSQWGEFNNRSEELQQVYDEVIPIKAEYQRQNLATLGDIETTLEWVELKNQSLEVLLDSVSTVKNQLQAFLNGENTFVNPLAKTYLEDALEYLIEIGRDYGLQINPILESTNHTQEIITLQQQLLTLDVSPRLPEDVKAKLDVVLAEIDSALEGKEATEINDQLTDITTRLTEEIDTYKLYINGLNEQFKEDSALLETAETDLKTAVEELLTEIETRNDYLEDKSILTDEVLGVLEEVRLADATTSPNTPESTPWQTVEFETNFAQTPVIFSQVQTANKSDKVRTRQQNGTANGFEVVMEEEEVKARNGETHANETIGYLAITEGTATSNGVTFESGATSNSVTHELSTINFENEFGNIPHLLAHIATYDGIDSSELRFQNLTQDNVQVAVQEDTTLDKETKHTTEVVNYLALEGDDFLRGLIPESSQAAKLTNLKLNPILQPQLFCLITKDP